VIGSVLGLLAGFMLILLLLAFTVLQTRVAVVYKLLLVLMVSGFYWVQYQSLLQFRGWPTTDDLPAEFILIATDVHEPDPTSGDEGVMYWWLRESGNPQQPPRVYQLPYRNELHQQTEQVVREQEQGAQYVGKKAPARRVDTASGISFEKISKASHYQKE